MNPEAVKTLQKKVDTAAAPDAPALTMKEAAAMEKNIQELLASVNVELSSAKKTDTDATAAMVARIGSMDIPPEKKDEMIERVTGIRPMHLDARMLKANAGESKGAAPSPEKRKARKEKTSADFEADLGAVRDRFLTADASYKKEKKT